MGFPGFACRDLADYALWCWRRSDAMRDMAFYWVSRWGFAARFDEGTHGYEYCDGEAWFIYGLRGTCPETPEPKSTICSA